MSAGSVLSEGRRFNEALMTDTFTVYRKTGATTVDPDTLEEVPVFAVVVEDVLGKLKDAEARPRVAFIPGIGAAVSSLEWHCPVETTGILTDDEVECTAVGDETGDPELVGTRVRITGPFAKSYATARRFPVEEVS